MRKPTVTIRVPATTSNLGPGFDTLGLALKLHNQISIRETDEPVVERTDAAKTEECGRAEIVEVRRLRHLDRLLSVTCDRPAR